MKTMDRRYFLKYFSATSCLLGLALLSPRWVLADEGHEHSRERRSDHDEPEEEKHAHGHAQEDDGHDEGHESTKEAHQGHEEHGNADHEEQEKAHADDHEHAAQGHGHGGRGHEGHDHAKPSFEKYGLVRAEKGYKEFNLRLQRFKYFPGTIRVNRGDRVKINLDSVDVEHGFYLDGYGINETVPEKGFKTVEFTATKSGAYRFRCSSTCGPFHPFMIGKLVVEPNRRFWSSLLATIAVPVGTLVYLAGRRSQ